MKITVYMLLIQTRHGVNTELFGTEAEADAALAAHVREEWSSRDPSYLADIDPSQLTDEAAVKAFYGPNCNSDDGATITPHEINVPGIEPAPPKDAYTVLLFTPGRESDLRDGTTSHHVTASSPEEAFGRAQDEAKAAIDYVDPPEDFAVLAVYGGHIEDLFQS